MSFLPQPCSSGGSCSCGTSDVSVSRVDAATSSTVLALENFGRKGIIFWNDSSSTAFLKLGSGASFTDYTWKIASQSGYELPIPIYMGEITAIWDTATGSMQITELV